MDNILVENFFLRLFYPYSHSQWIYGYRFYVRSCGYKSFTCLNSYWNGFNIVFCVHNPVMSSLFTFYKITFFLLLNPEQMLLFIIKKKEKKKDHVVSVMYIRRAIEKRYWYHQLFDALLHGKFNTKYKILNDTFLNVMARPYTHIIQYR